MSQNNPKIVLLTPNKIEVVNASLFHQKHKAMSTKTTKIIYWTTTIIIFLFEGVMPALTGNSDMAKKGISDLGYPDYFRVALNVFKVAGTLLLILPFIGKRLKEWAYAGFTFDFIFACISHYAVKGLAPLMFFPLIVLAILMVSYVTYHKLLKERIAG